MRADLRHGLAVTQPEKARKKVKCAGPRSKGTFLEPIPGSNINLTHAYIKYLNRICLLCVVTLLPWVYTYFYMFALLGPPTADKSKSQTIAYIGETVKLTCPVYGVPAPMIQWSKNGQHIDFHWERHKAKKNILKIKHVTEDDTGIFMCKAINGFGSIQVRVELIVIGKLKFYSLFFSQTVPRFFFLDMAAVTRSS